MAITREPSAGFAATISPMNTINSFLLAGAMFSNFSLHAADISTETFEKDRKAILSMTGEFSVSFYFHETFPLNSGYQTKERPYEEEAFETVKVAEDDGTRIILQVERVVVKHWSQVWTYEDREILAFLGHSRWEKQAVSQEGARGTWTQRITEMTDAPRYEAAGRWVHNEESSEWPSDVTNRPLPRREYTKRSDYELLRVTNRHTVTAAGWFHEQDNTKWVKRDGKEFPICREVGLNQYIRVSDGEFAKADTTWSKPAVFWKQVRAAWDESIVANPTITLREESEDSSLYKKMNALAKRASGGETVPDAEIRETINAFLVADPDQTQP